MFFLLFITTAFITNAPTPTCQLDTFGALCPRSTVQETGIGASMVGLRLNIFHQLISIEDVILFYIPKLNLVSETGMIEAFDGTVGSGMCQFPFEHNDETYHQCIKTDNFDNWCTTTDGRWGFCKLGKLIHLPI